MANLCSECDHIITIGYLKSFIGDDIHSSTDDSVLYVDYDDDTYCPTYSELTGGTLIQNGETGETPNGDIDGIIIGGSYSENQCVREEDMSMMFTRFNSLTISADPTIMNEDGQYVLDSPCSGETTLSFSHVYDRTTRSHANECESFSDTTETVNDTNVNEVTFSSSKPEFVVNGLTVSVGKNDPSGIGKAKKRGAYIRGAINFHGIGHLSNKIAIIQPKLSGSYEFWYNDSLVHDIGVSCYPSGKVSYLGGEASAETYYYLDTWEVHQWVDDCGESYSADTIETAFTYNTYHIYDTKTYTFSTLECEEAGKKYKFKFTWPEQNWSGNCTALQEANPNPCTDCPPKPYTSYTDVIANCEDGEAWVSGVVHTFTGGHTDEFGNCVGYTETTAETGYSVSWDCCDGGGLIDPHVEVVGAPCCPTSITYTYGKVYLECEAAASFVKDVPYTATTHTKACTTTISYGTSAITMPAVECNTGSTKRIDTSAYGYTNPKVYQYGGCSCVNCDCSQLALGSSSASWKASSTSTKNITYTIAESECITSNITTNSNSLSYFTATVNDGYISVTPVGTNPTQSPYVETLLVYYTARDAGSQCTSSVTLTQKATACTPTECTCYLVGNATAETVSSTATSTTVTWAYSAITWTTASTCSVSSALTSQGTSTKTITFDAATCESTTKSGSFTWSDHKKCTSTGCSTSDVKVSWTINQEEPAGCGCSCENIQSHSYTFNYNEKGSSVKQVIFEVSGCCSSPSVTLSDTTNFRKAVSTNGDGDYLVYVCPYTANSNPSERTCTVSISTTCGNSTCEKSETVTQLGHLEDCDCDDINIELVET